MVVRKLLLGALLASSLGGLSIPAMAADVYFNFAPPPVRVERTPQPRAGYVWVPGYWDTGGRKYVWKSGRWERDRPGYYYQSHRWTERDGRWYREQGGWHNQKDRDHDGTPDRLDSHPDNPRRN